MRILGIALIVAVVAAPCAMGQAVTGYAGGFEYPAYYGTLPGDVVGYRFTVANSVQVSDLGVWNQDTSTGGAGLSASHQVGIWDGSQTLIASTTVTTSGTVNGSWTYASITPVVLNPGQTYTIGALYPGNDNDSYLSGCSTLTMAAGVTFVQSVYPASEGLGFVFPAGNSTSSGRLGPNFLFSVVPVELQSFVVE
ncbi:MAG: DUF4082 domain-containing protein [Acidobacteria bacterium]|nr:DUF4082 domain-containing protein [Acidobacteriota bacterium]